MEEDERRERDERSERVGGLKIIEVVPPYVDTALNAENRAQTDALQGGKEKAVQPMALGEYVDGFFEGLEEGEEEIAVGFAKKGVWGIDAVFGDGVTGDRTGGGLLSWMVLCHGEVMMVEKRIGSYG